MVDVCSGGSGSGRGGAAYCKLSGNQSGGSQSGGKLKSRIKPLLIASNHYLTAFARARTILSKKELPQAQKRLSRYHTKGFCWHQIDIETITSTIFTVWKNYFKIAWRNIRANKLRTAIHLTGLAIGIAVCYIVFSVVSYSYSFDRFHPKKDNIYQITTLTTYLDDAWPNTGVPFPLTEVVQSELPGVMDAAHFYTLNSVQVQSDEEGKSLGRNNAVVFSDNGFFRLFEREWLAGDPTNALEDPNAVVLTESSLQRYFPGQTASQVLGRQLFYIGQDTIPAKVTGVVKNYTQNSDLFFTDFISKASLELLGEERFHRHSWNTVNSSSHLFIVLQEQFSEAEIEAALESVVEKYIQDEEGSKTTFFIQALSELHFTHSFPLPRADKSILKGLTLIGLILLLIASLNFINLETAHAISRSKEVGIRKTLGSSRPQLMQQFLTETFVLILLAIAVSFFLTELISAYFKEFLPAGLTLSFFSF